MPNAHTQAPNDNPFCFSLLGELRITQNGRDISPPPFRTHGLLAALLLNPGPQRRERLVGLLFPDLPESAGRRRLSDLLWLLRCSLPDLPLDSEAQQVCLPKEIRWLDVEAFRQAAARPDLDDWLEALSLYQGDLLESLYDNWLLEERETLYLGQIHLLHRTCRHLIQHQEFDRALPIVERLNQSEPYDERALRSLMVAYREVGRRGAALAAYERFVALAADELGAEPEPSTQALAEAIRCTTPRVQPGVVSITCEGDSPEALLRYGQEALLRGDRATAEESLQRLNACFRTFPTDAYCLLEVDLALFCEEFDRAALLLESCNSQQAPVLVRIAQLALERRQTAVASDTASKALILAHEAGDRQTELGAMLVLAGAQRRLGQGVQAARSAEQALSLARACTSMEGIARALIVKAHNQLRQGRYAQALSLYLEASSLAHEHDLRPCLASALHRIAWIYAYQGKLADALANGKESLSICRDLGMRGQEANNLQLLAYTLAVLGRTAESLRALERAQQLCEELGEPVKAAINQYHLADTLLYHDEDLASQAIAITQEALDIFHAHNQPGWQAATLTTEGRAQWLAGQHIAAIEAFCEAHRLYEQLGELAFLPELWAFQGLAYLGMRHCSQGLDCTRRALLSLTQGEVSDEAVSDVYYAHAMALAACDQEEQAHNYLVLAYEQLLTVAAQLEDETARQAFFHHNPTTRRLMEALYDRGIVPHPTAGIVSQRLPSARDGRPVQVQWTVDAGPSDLALKQAQGAITLRRARLSRLLQEAQAQGAAPTVAQLAQALNVSKRTVQRDLATLRQLAEAA